MEDPNFVSIIDRNGEDDFIAPGQTLGPLCPQHHLRHVQQIWGQTKQIGWHFPCSLLGFGSPSQETCSSFLGTLANQSLCLVGCDPNALFPSLLPAHPWHGLSVTSGRCQARLHVGWVFQERVGGFLAAGLMPHPALLSPAWSIPGPHHASPGTSAMPQPCLHALPGSNELAWC